MRLLPHILLAFAAVGLQRGLDALLSIGTARLDLVMIVACYSATCFPKSTGPIAAGLIGLAYDFSGVGPLGLHAAALGLGGLAAAALPKGRWTQLLGALVAGVIVATLTLWLLGNLRWGINNDPLPAGPSIGGFGGTILLTGLFAVPMSLPLWRWRRVFLVDTGRL